MQIVGEEGGIINNFVISHVNRSHKTGHRADYPDKKGRDG
jgi:hypothetical protein